MFIHGALCIGYSGQCLLSSLIGGRSGNRGECAQPCRLPWRISSAPVGADGDSGSAKPCLSPRDQACQNTCTGSTAAGVTSFKIEGRMKSAGYVGQVTAVYRKILDQDMSVDGSHPTDPSISDNWKNRAGGCSWHSIAAAHLPTAISAAAGRLTFSAAATPAATACSWAKSRLAIRSRHLTDRNTPGITRRLVARARRYPLRAPGGASEEKASAPLGEVSLGAGRLTVKGFHPDALRKTSCSVTWLSG